MSHQPTHRHTLAAPTPQISKPKSLTTNNTTTSAVHHLTHRLSRLNPNPKPQPTKPQTPNPPKLPNTHSLSKSASLDPKTAKQGKRVVVMERKDNVVAKVEIDKRSFCEPQIELDNFLAKNCAKVVSVDMPPFMQIHAVGLARNTKDSLEKFTSKSLALSLKKEFDEVYGPAWHCIVGTSFGSFVTHSVGGFLYFSLDQKVYILLFKTSVERAN